MEEIILGLSTVVFAAHFVWVAGQVWRGGLRESWVGLALMLAGFGLQSWFLWERGQHHGRCPITNGMEVLVFMVWAMVLWYLALGPSYRVSLVGVATSGLVAVGQAVAWLVGGEPVARRAGGVVDPWLEMHGALSLLAYGAFGMAALAGVLFVWHDRQLKRRPLMRVVVDLPPITHLFRAMMLMVTLGGLMLLGGMAAGYLAHGPVGGAKQAVGYVVLGIYGLLVAGRWRGWSHRRVAVGAVGGFVFAVATLWVVS